MHSSTEVYYSMSGSPHCTVTQNPPRTAHNDGTTPPPSFEIVERQLPVTKGDRVHATPYWSYVHKAGTTDKFDVHYSYQWTLPGYAGDLPPRLCSPVQQAGSVIKGVFSPWSFAATPPTLSLPTGTAAQWAFLRAMADTKARANINKGLVNLPLLYAERRETASLIATNVVRMSDAVRDVARRDLSRYKTAVKRADKRKVARSIANEHLALIFGLLPLIDETESLVELLERPRLDFVRSRGTATMVLGESPILVAKSVTAPSSISGVNPANLVATVTSAGVTRSTISVRTALRYKLHTQLAQAGRHLGFEPIGAAFDLYPLSFLVGWFSNLDDYIRALAPVIGAEFETGSRNLRRRNNAEFSLAVTPAVARPVYGNPTRWLQPPSIAGIHYYVANMEHNVRSVLAGPPGTSAHWDVDVGLYEIAAGLSLTIQRYVKPLKRIAKAQAFRYRAPRPKWLGKIRYTGGK